jgi:hypothetical protein
MRRWLKAAAGTRAAADAEAVNSERRLTPEHARSVALRRIAFIVTKHLSSSGSRAGKARDRSPGKALTPPKVPAALSGTGRRNKRRRWFLAAGRTGDVNSCLSAGYVGIGYVKIRCALDALHSAIQPSNLVIV